MKVPEGKQPKAKFLGSSPRMDKKIELQEPINKKPQPECYTPSSFRNIPRNIRGGPKRGTGLPQRGYQVINGNHVRGGACKRGNNGNPKLIYRGIHPSRVHHGNLSRPLPNDKISTPPLPPKRKHSSDQPFSRSPLVFDDISQQKSKSKPTTPTGTIKTIRKPQQELNATEIVSIKTVRKPKQDFQVSDQIKRPIRSPVQIKPPIDDINKPKPSNLSQSQLNSQKINQNQQQQQQKRPNPGRSGNNFNQNQQKQQSNLIHQQKQQSSPRGGLRNRNFNTMRPNMNVHNKISSSSSPNTIQKNIQHKKPNLSNEMQKSNSLPNQFYSNHQTKQQQQQQQQRNLPSPPSNLPPTKRNLPGNRNQNLVRMNTSPNLKGGGNVNLMNPSPSSVNAKRADTLRPKGPTRATRAAPNNMIDSRFEDRYRPLSIFFEANNSCLLNQDPTFTHDDLKNQLNDINNDKDHVHSINDKQQQKQQSDDIIIEENPKISTPSHDLDSTLEIHENEKNESISCDIKDDNNDLDDHISNSNSNSSFINESLDFNKSMTQVCQNPKKANYEEDSFDDDLCDDDDHDDATNNSIQKTPEKQPLKSMNDKSEMLNEYIDMDEDNINQDFSPTKVIRGSIDHVVIGSDSDSEEDEEIEPQTQTQPKPSTPPKTDTISTSFRPNQTSNPAVSFVFKQPSRNAVYDHVVVDD